MRAMSWGAAARCIGTRCRGAPPEWPSRLFLPRRPPEATTLTVTPRVAASGLSERLASRGPAFAAAQFARPRFPIRARTDQTVPMHPQRVQIISKRKGWVTL
jgi:hypothetical protein